MSSVFFLSQEKCSNIFCAPLIWRLGNGLFQSLGQWMTFVWKHCITCSCGIYTFQHLQTSVTFVLTLQVNWYIHHTMNGNTLTNENVCKLKLGRPSAAAIIILKTQASHWYRQIRSSFIQFKYKAGLKNQVTHPGLMCVQGDKSIHCTVAEAWPTLELKTL